MPTLILRRKLKRITLPPPTNKPSEESPKNATVASQTTHQNDLAALSYHDSQLQLRNTTEKEAATEPAPATMNKKSPSTPSDNTTAPRKASAVATSDDTTASASSDKRNTHSSDRKRKASHGDEELARERVRRNKNKLCSAMDV